MNSLQVNLKAKPIPSGFIALCAGVTSLILYISRVSTFQYCVFGCCCRLPG